MANNKYSENFKRQIVEQYMNGGSIMKLIRENGISDKSLIKKWKIKYLEQGYVSDNRKRWYNNPIDPSKMSKDDYINHLEMENDILKQIRSLTSNPKK